MQNAELKWENMDLNYEGENKFASFFSSQGNIHTYPAKAVPEMVKDLIQKIRSENKINNVLDPFVGSGTTALEAKYIGLNFYGSDLNPLAVLLARTKSLTINHTAYIKKHLLEFVNKINTEYSDAKFVPLFKFKNIDFWFKPENIRELSFIRDEIKKDLDKAKSNRECYALILLTAFSSTIRKVSLTRNGEFKLYRMTNNSIEKHNLNAINVFSDVIKNLFDMLVEANINYRKDISCDIYLRNAKNIDYLKDNSISLVITSPPYGDSRSTVAYGQFSRLSIQWMSDLMLKYLKIPMVHEDCDELLLGGGKSDSSLQDASGFYSSLELSKLLSDIDSKIVAKQNEDDEVKLLLSKIAEKPISDLRINDITSNNLLYKLIFERIRLDIYRKISKKKNKLSDKQIKKIALEQSEKCLMEFSDVNNEKYSRRQKLVAEKLDKVQLTVNRNYESLSKRRTEVLLFFQDLYKVVLETDRVLENNGFQVWIVGHRTVLGNITVNMEGIIKDWFSNLGYNVIKSLNRKYSFKRMPHHINSTIERSEPINTMMNEYILVVQKRNPESNPIL